MAEMVHTAVGLVERDRLTVKDVVSETPTSRDMATEWYLDDRLVRRDAWANMKLPTSIGGETGVV